MKSKPITMDLPCTLTTEEVDAKSESLASLTLRVEKLKAERKASAKSFKEDIDKLETAARSLAQQVHRREITRPVRCTIRLSTSSPDTVVIERDDTLEIIETRAMTDSERQQDLEMGDDEPTVQ